MESSKETRKKKKTVTLSVSQPHLNSSEEKECEIQQEGNQATRRIEILYEREREDDCDEIDHLDERVQCITLRKRRSTKGISGKNGLWRREQKTRVARLEKQLKARWKLEELIEEQLNRFPAHYNHAMVPAKLKDVPRLLMPKWSTPHELATLAWLGDWRPSAILDLVHALVQSSSVSLPFSSNSNGAERLLSQLIHEIRIEEAIINEEMAEIQATCIIQLPFAPVRNHRTGATALSCVQAEFEKIERVITKAQQLRFKALELAMKKVLSQTAAAEFLVAFAGIQDVIHQFAAKRRSARGSVVAPVKGPGPLMDLATLGIDFKWRNRFTVL